MPQGLEVYDSSGVLKLSITDRLSRVLGSIDISTNGSIIVAGFADGTPWVTFLPWAFVNVPKMPSISVSGTTLSWTYPGSGNVSGTLIYGIY